MDRGYVARNRAAAERLERTIAALSPESMALDAGEGWTVSALLAHLSFWDRYVLVRWNARADGQLTPAAVPDHVADLVNDAAIPAWRRLPGDAVLDLVRSAAADTDAFLATLPDASLAAIAAEGRPRLLDRSLHRTEHLDMIDRAIAGRSGPP